MGDNLEIQKYSFVLIHWADLSPRWSEWAHHEAELCCFLYLVVLLCLTQSGRFISKCRMISGMHKRVSWEPTEGASPAQPGCRTARDGLLEQEADLKSEPLGPVSVPSPGGLKMCVWVEVRNVWAPEESLWVSSLSRAPEPLGYNMMQVALVWPVASPEVRGFGSDAGAASPSVLKTISVQNDGMGWCRTNWKKEVLSSPFHGSFVSSELFSAGVVYISSELKELLCSRRYRKHRPVWEGPRHWARPTCLSGWMGWVFRNSWGGWNVVLKPEVAFFSPPPPIYN